MALTIHQDAIGNKYIGYAGDLANVATGQEIIDNSIALVQSFPNNIAQLDFRLGWRTDGANFSFSKSDFEEAFFTLYIQLNSGVRETTLGARDVGPSDIHVIGNEQYDQFSVSIYPKDATYAVGYSNGVDVGFFFWTLDGSNNFDNSLFVWAGEVKGNSNISVPQTRSGITIQHENGAFLRNGSFGVKQGDSSTQRLHLDTEAGASHNIDCAEETGRLFLIEDDGAGGDGGTVGYCENLYLSKQTGLTVGGFVTLNGITDGGSTHGIVVGNWGTDAKIIMRVYDGTN